MRTKEWSILFALGLTLVALLYWRHRSELGEQGAHRSTQLAPEIPGASADADAEGRVDQGGGPFVSGADTPPDRPSRRRIESTLLSPAGIRADRASEILEGDGFPEFLAELDRQNAADLEARQLTAAYSKEFAAVVTKTELDLDVANMACGLSICAADLTGSSADQALFTPLMSAGSKSGARVFTAVTAIVPNRDGSYSYRMIFATDPRFTSIQVPRRDWQPRPVPQP